MRKHVWRKLVSIVAAFTMLFTTVFGLLPNELGSSATVKAAANPTARVSVHDPSIVKENGIYYIFGSHMAFAKSSNLSEWSNFTTNINSDYASIFSVGKVWSETGVNSYDISGNLWAPDVVYNKAMKKWCMYMSVNGADWNSSVALCTADNIEGPYTYAGTVVYSGFTNSSHPVSMTDYYQVCGDGASINRYLNSNGSWNYLYGTNAIDPSVFYDEDGTLWMVYGSWFGGLFMLELDENTGLRDYTVSYPLDTDSSDGIASDPYLGVRIAGGQGASGEAPYIEHIDGYYYLFATYGGLDSNGGYNMRVFRSENPTGPYKDAAGNYATYTTPVGASNTSGNIGIRFMTYYRWSCMDVGQIAQGHNSVLSDTDGKKYLVYHTRFDDGTYTHDDVTYNHEFHEVRVHQLFANEDGWLVAAPYEYLGETISSTGYSSTQVVGSYEFLIQNPNQIYHDAATSGGYPIEATTTIQLNSDGTVTGSVSGTWSMANGKPDMQITYNGVTYKGVFLKQYDESASRKEVMTFTAVGSNNICIWGSMGTDNTSETINASVDDGEYYIRNVNSGKYLNADGGLAADGTNINQWEYNGSHAQKFKLVSDPTGFYTLYTGSSDYTKCLDIVNGSPSDGTNIVQWEYNGSHAQKFKLVENSMGYVFLTQSSSSTSALDVYEMSLEDGGNVCQWSYWGGEGQTWLLEKVQNYVDLPDGTYQLKNVNSGKYLNVENGSAADGTNINQWEYNGSHAQKFKFVSDNSGYYTIYTGSSDFTKCLDAADGSAADGTNIHQWSHNGSHAQRFKIAQNSDGSYAILTQTSNCSSTLDIYEMSMDDGGNVCEWSFWGGDGQRWIIESV